MISGKFDERCPKCGKHIAPYDHFQQHDYALEFSVECPGCSEKLVIEVHSVPEFEIFTQEAVDADHKRTRERFNNYVKEATTPSD